MAEDFIGENPAERPGERRRRCVPARTIDPYLELKTRDGDWGKEKKTIAEPSRS